MHASWLAFFLDSTALDSPPVWKSVSLEVARSDMGLPGLGRPGLGSGELARLTRSCQRPSHCPPLPWLVIASSARGASSGKRGNARLGNRCTLAQTRVCVGSHSGAREPASFTAGLSRRRRLTQELTQSCPIGRGEVRNRRGQDHRPAAACNRPEGTPRWAIESRPSTSCRHRLQGADADRGRCGTTSGSRHSGRTRGPLRKWAIG